MATPPSTVVRRGLPLLVYESLILLLLVLPNLIDGELIKYVSIVLMGVIAYSISTKYGRYIYEIKTIPDLQLLLIVLSAVVGVTVGIGILDAIYLQYAITLVLVAAIINLLEFASVLK